MTKKANKIRVKITAGWEDLNSLYSTIEGHAHFKNFEITIIVRDKNGNPTGQRKTISSDNSSDLYNFVESNKPRKKRRRKKNQKKNEGNS